MLKKIIVAVIMLVSSVNVFSQDTKKEIVIKAISEINDNMTQLSFNVENEFTAKEFESWVVTSKGMEIIKEATITNKKNKEVTWVFKQSPTLRDFKVLFAMLNIQHITVKDKKMPAVEFTTFGFSNNSTTK